MKNKGSKEEKFRERLSISYFVAASWIIKRTLFNEPFKPKSTGLTLAAATLNVLVIFLEIMSYRVQVSKINAPSLRCINTISSTSKGFIGLSQE